MIRHRFILGIILSFIFFSNCSENKFESYYLTEISKDTSLVEYLKMVEDFEDYLLKNNFVLKIDKENYKILMEKAFEDEIVLQLDSNFYKEVDAWLFETKFPFGQASFINAFDSWNGKIDANSTAYKISQFQKERMINGAPIDSLMNSKLFESIKESDFEKTIYRAPFTYIIYVILERNYSNYHKWKTVDNIYFQENAANIDFEKSNLEFLDSLCANITPENYTSFHFIALGIDNENDSVDYNLTVERTNYIVNYLVEKKGLHPRQAVAVRIPKNSQVFRFDIYRNLFKKRKTQMLFFERLHKS
jgi:hypothetical protein